MACIPALEYGSGPKITFEQNYLQDVTSWDKICFDKKLSFALHALVQVFQNECIYAHLLFATE